MRISQWICKLFHCARESSVDVSRLDLGPGDIVVLKCSGYLSKQAVEGIKRTWAGIGTGNKCIVLQGDMEISVIRKSWTGDDA